MKVSSFIKKLSPTNKILLLSSLFFLINFVIKWYKINSIPAGHTYDEIIYVSEAQSLLRFGTNLAQTWKPTDLEPADGMYSELTSSVLAPAFLLFPNKPIIASKIIPVIFGSLIPVLVALISYYFFSHKKIFISVALVATTNPWIFQFSRTGFDSLFSIFFYLLGIVTLLYSTKWLKLLSFPIFFLGFFQYQGHKPLLVPLLAVVITSLLLKMIKRKLTIKTVTSSIKSFFPELAVFLLCFILTVSYLLRLNNLTTSVRSQEIAIVDQAEISHVVDEYRRLSFDFPLSKLFSNKLTLTAQLIFKRFLKSFDPTYLFIQGNAHVDTFSVLDYGYFHYHDLFLILIAFLLISKRKENNAGILFLLLFTVVGTLPNLIRSGEPWITFRGAFAFIGLVMIVGVSLGSLIKKMTPKQSIITLVFYLLLTSPFFYTYFFRYPITYGKHSGFYERVLASYVKRQSNTNFLLITDRADATFDYLATYNQYYQTDNADELLANSQAKIKTVDHGRVMITAQCPKDWSIIQPNTVIAIDLTKEPCGIPNEYQTGIPRIEIKSLVDSGTRFNLYNDQLCHNQIIHRYQNLKQNLLAVEKLDDKLFCETFFMK